jgi:hypothetical protein
MQAPNASLRQDLIQNAVHHELAKLEEMPPSLARLLQLDIQQFGSQTRLDPALTDSGVYRGTIIATVQDIVVQAITSQSAVIHRKDRLDRVPSVGQHVRIRYSDGVAQVEPLRERSHVRELGR